MSDARREILARIGRALADVPSGERPDDVPVARDYRQHSELAAGSGELVELFAARVLDYGAEVLRCRGGDVGAQVAAACRARGLQALVAADELPAAWLPAGVELHRDDALTAAELDRIGAALTGCAVAIAETGTIVLDGGARCGRRALTLVPDHHLCVIARAQLVALVPEALAAVASAATTQRRPITLISGPSATSDIELTRVQGVHGPRDLVVVIAG
jgi:L-lactate dehydrogenase complex protein LldG